MFVSNRSGSMNLWALDVKSAGLTQVTSGPGPDYRPVFSPAGDRIAYFTRSEDGSHQLAVATWPDMKAIPVAATAQFAWVHGPFWFHTTDAILIHALRRGESSASLWMLFCQRAGQSACRYRESAAVRTGPSTLPTR